MPTIVRAYLSILLATVLGGCVAGPRGEIADLAHYPQDAAAYLAPGTETLALVAPELQAQLDADYDRHFFAPWRLRQASVPAAAAFAVVRELGAAQGYGENLLPLAPQRWQALVAALRRESYPSLARAAITVRNTACRAVPTARPFFLDPRRPGEGYPFDYFQSSALWVGTPLLVTHVSADGAWLFAESGFVYGWLPAGDVAWADEAFRQAYQTGRYAAVLRDGVTLSSAGDFLAQAPLGAIFPLAGEAAAAQLLVPVRGADGAATIRTATPAPTEVAPKPLPLQPGQLAVLANRLLGQAYGWGGVYENRDCSATLRDLFAPFGLWLPRNSAAQARQGALHDLSALPADAKRARILQQGIPFYTLLWLQGHIGLYLGADPVSGEPVLLHNLWGVRTRDWFGRDGRALVGRLAITSLRPGEERSDVAAGQFYRRILGMTVLPGAKE